jgi:signal transduction histidine kinase
MRLRTKLTLTATVIVILAVFISTFLVITFTKQNAINDITVSGTADFEEFCKSFQNSMLYESLNMSDRLSYSYLRFRFYTIHESDEFVLQEGGAIISNNTGIDAVRALNAHRVTSTDIDYVVNTLRHSICHIGDQYYFIASTNFNIDEQKEYTLSLVRNVTSTMDDVNGLGIKCALAGAAVIIAAALLVFLLVRRSLLPVRELEKGAAEISDGNYESRIPVKGHDEIASLAERFNRMAEAIFEKIAALNETAERQQTFINALSHEMKTPVTSVMARAETLLVRDISEDDKKRSLERIYNQCAWLEKLSGKLTALVMLQGRVDVKPENVRELLAAVEETVMDALDEKNITLAIDCKMDTLPVDFDLMRAALANLVDNAIKASERGSIIELRAYDNIIEVEDHGRGIPKEEIERIIQPFYMVDRSRSKKTGGSGLGLALVERIAKAHDAKLSIISTLGEGTTVKIVFSLGNIDK